MSEGGEGLQGLREETEPVEPETEGGADDSIESDDGPESVRETVAKEYERLQREAEATTEGAEDAETEVSEKPEVKPGEKLVKKRGRPSKADIAAREQQGFQIPAPNRLTLQQKEIFHQLPDELKRATHQMFRDFQAQHSQIVNKTTAAEREARGVSEAVRPYLLAHPELAAEGYTESRFVAGLVAAHQRLTDPKTQRQALAELCQQQGLRQEIVNAILQDAPAAPQSQIATLPDDAREAIEYVKRMRTAQQTQAAQSILSELESVQNEIGPDGRYAYPMLHDGAFLEQWKPLVSALARTLPYADAGREAYRILTRGDGNSAQVNQARLPAQQNPQMQRAQQAAVSVRGRSAPSVPPGANWLDEIPVEKLGSPRDTVRLALENMRRGAPQ